MYGRDGYDYDGYRLRVEFPRSGRGTGRGGGGGGGGGAPRGRYGPPSRRSENRVVVSGELTWIDEKKGDRNDLIFLGLPVCQVFMLGLELVLGEFSKQALL